MHFSLATGCLPAKSSAPSPPLAFRASITTEAGGQLGRRLIPVSIPPATPAGSGCQHPTHPPDILAFTSRGPWQGWARNATLGPGVQFPGWGLAESGPGQVAQAGRGRDFLPPRGRGDHCQLPMPIPVDRCSRECPGDAQGLRGGGGRETCPGKMG